MRATVYLLELPPSFTSAQIQTMMAEYGHVYGCCVMHTPHGKIARVQFGTLEEMRRASRAIQGTDVRGRRVTAVTCESTRGAELEELYLNAAMPPQS